MPKFTNAILKANVGHERLFPKNNKFSYKVFYSRIQIRKGKDVYPKFFSIDSWNILSLKTSMHGAKDGTSWYDWITAQLTDATIPFDEGCSIYLISHPRLFGYAFNPISYWMVHRADGTLYCVLTEVRNTFKEYHNYLLYHSDYREILTGDVFKAKKELYVSPFNTMKGWYEFTFSHTESTFKSVINYCTDEGMVVRTYMGGKFLPMSSLEIIKTVLLYPAMTLLVVARIHWQAVKLWYKRVKPTLDIQPKEYTSGKTTTGKDISTL